MFLNFIDPEMTSVWLLVNVNSRLYDSGKIARSMMPAPPPPPPPPAPHQSAAMSGSVVGGQASQPTESPSRPGDHGCQPGIDPDFPVASASNTSPEHKSGTRRPGALTHTDISAPILTSPDLMSRSFSTPSTEVRNNSVHHLFVTMDY